MSAGIYESQELNLETSIPKGGGGWEPEVWEDGY